MGLAGVRAFARCRGSVWGANGTASTHEVRHIYWGSLQGLRHSGARACHDAAALRNHGEESSHSQREKERGKGHGVFLTTP